MDDISAAFGTGNCGDILTEEEIRDHLAKLGDFAHRHPIKKDFWEDMETLSIRDAVLFTLGIEPDTLAIETDEGLYHGDMQPLPDDYWYRLRIVKSAVLAGTIPRVAISGNESDAPNEQTLILAKQFHNWYGKKNYIRKPTKAKPTYPQYQPEITVTKESNTRASEDLPTKERVSMLKLIIGMAICFYGYDPKSKRSAVTGETPDSIHADLLKAGFNFDVGSIRKYIKEAKELIPPDDK